jgi:hypothetical protein
VLGLRRLPFALALFVVVVLPVRADSDYRLVFGSFTERANAQRWAVEVARRVGVGTDVLATTDPRGTRFRVVTAPLPPTQLLSVSQSARAAGLDFWRLAETATATPPAPPAPVAAAPATVPTTVPSPVSPPPSPVGPDLARAIGPRTDFDVDLGLQSRTFAERGFDHQARLQPSLSTRFDYGVHWDNDRYAFRAAPFVRYDAEDSARTHADLREFYVSAVGEQWELHAGLRQVFWGVTEFEHLIDVINQTDLVENIDGEDKLGQPMINLSVVRDWGILDFYLLPGFRERTFPGGDGRLRYLVPVSTKDTRYESGSEQYRVDGAARWVHHVGPVEFGIYHFSGTSRDPTLRVQARPNGKLVLAPYYPVIDQTALDAQAIAGDWIYKLEALTRAGQGGRYAAATGGFERTLVGVLGTRTDLGLVLEYLWDERGDDADTLFEHDVALAGRFRFNDVADTQTLLGVIWDHRTHEYIVKLEGSRRLGDDWGVIVEGRVFGGVAGPGANDVPGVLATLADPDRKSASLARDDYVQLELTRYF